MQHVPSIPFKAAVYVCRADMALPCPACMTQGVLDPIIGRLCCPDHNPFASRDAESVSAAAATAGAMHMGVLVASC